jgi:chromosome segregation ATPase
VYNSLDSVKILADSLMQTSDLIRQQKVSKKEANQFINNTMNNIDSLMRENKSQIAALEAKLNSSNMKKGILQKMLDRLRKELSEKEDIIVRLNTQISQLEKDVEGLRIEKRNITTKLAASQTQLQQKQQEVEKIATDMAQKIRQIDDLTKSSNAGYYLVGQKKELAKKGIVKTRGLLNKVDGLGDVLNEDEMHRLDISSQTLNIDIGNASLKNKDIVIVPSRPDNLYIISQDHGRTYLHIINKDFWKKSKFLVVVIQ